MEERRGEPQRNSEKLARKATLKKPVLAIALLFVTAASQPSFPLEASDGSRKAAALLESCSGTAADVGVRPWEGGALEGGRAGNLGDQMLLLLRMSPQSSRRPKSKRQKQPRWATGSLSTLPHLMRVLWILSVHEFGLRLLQMDSFS